MITKEEVKSIVDYSIETNRISDLVIFVCTSGYPVPFDEVHLVEVRRLREVNDELVKGYQFFWSS